MNAKVHNQIIGYILSIADDVLRDVFVRGKYRDIILPFTVLRRLDALLVPNKEKVLEANIFLIKIDNGSGDREALCSTTANELMMQFVSDIQQILRQARQTAYHSINKAMLEAYWLVGKRIVDE